MHRMQTRSMVLPALAGLAAAMGMGRFAFTPLLPLMQAGGLTLSQGAWLAGANYLGYLLGALAGAVWGASPSRAARGGLLVVALATLAMAPEPGFTLALCLRFAAGVASAYVLVGISAWMLDALAAQGRADASGAAYAGVGIGMVVAGIVALGVGIARQPASLAWALLGALAAGGGVSALPLLQPGAAAAPA